MTDQPHTPSLNEVRAAYQLIGGPYMDRYAAMFDRMIEAVRAEEREKAARVAESSTRPLSGHGSMTEGSRSQWYANGVRDAAARIRAQGKEQDRG